MICCPLIKLSVQLRIICKLFFPASYLSYPAEMSVGVEYTQGLEDKRQKKVVTFRLPDHVGYLCPFVIDGRVIFEVRKLEVLHQSCHFFIVEGTIQELANLNQVIMDTVVKVGKFSSEYLFNRTV